MQYVIIHLSFDCLARIRLNTNCSIVFSASSSGPTPMEVGNHISIATPTPAQAYAAAAAGAQQLHQLNNNTNSGKTSPFPLLPPLGCNSIYTTHIHTRHPAQDLETGCPKLTIFQGRTQYTQSPNTTSWEVD